MTSKTENRSLLEPPDSLEADETDAAEEFSASLENDTEDADEAVVEATEETEFDDEIEVTDELSSLLAAEPPPPPQPLNKTISRKKPVTAPDLKSANCITSSFFYRYTLWKIILQSHCIYLKSLRFKRELPLAIIAFNFAK